VIFGLTGLFIEHFYEPVRDVILNLLDARCPRWSVFDECRDEAEFTGAAEALARDLMTAELAEVQKLMCGTIADPLTAPEAARMAESIRAVFNAKAKALKMLPREGPHFSMRKWIEGEGNATAISPLS
jgi:hypothetical protein